METIVQALDHYFEKLIAFWREDDTYPLIPWSEEDDQTLFVSGPNEDGEAEWKPAAADIPEGLPELSPELRAFFGCRRFWRLAGRLKRRNYTFAPLPTDEAAVNAAKTALRDGEHYLGCGYALLASVVYQGNDDLLLLYNQRTGAMTLLDVDKEVTTPLDVSLPELIEQMEVLI